MFNKVKNVDIDNNSEKNSEKYTLKEMIFTVLIAIVISIVAVNFIRISKIDGHSMDYTLKDGEKVLLNTHIYKNNIPERDDVVVVDRKDLSVRYFIKRVIAIEGDTLEIKNNVVYLNGEELKEDYIKEDMVTRDLKVEIPEGKVFVMGDNRNNSVDSRSNIIGLIDVKEEILGKAIYHIPSFKKIK